MPIKYTVFPLTSSTTTNILVVDYRALISATEEETLYFDNHLIEIIIYSLNQLIFTDFVISELKANGFRAIYTQQRPLNKLISPFDYFNSLFETSPRPSNYLLLRRIFSKSVNSGSNLYP